MDSSIHDFSKHEKIVQITNRPNLALSLDLIDWKAHVAHGGVNGVRLNVAVHVQGPGGNVIDPFCIFNSSA